MAAAWEVVVLAENAELERVVLAVIEVCAFAGEPTATLAATATPSDSTPGANSNLPVFMRRSFRFAYNALGSTSVGSRNVTPCGACATPARVFKGMGMPGQHGNSRVTTLNLEVVEGDPERGLLLLRGSVPGPSGSIVFVRDAVKPDAGRERAHQ